MLDLNLCKSQYAANCFPILTGHETYFIQFHFSLVLNGTDVSHCQTVPLVGPAEDLAMEVGEDSPLSLSRNAQQPQINTAVRKSLYVTPPLSSANPKPGKWGRATSTALTP